MKVGIAVLLCLAFLLGSAVTQLVIGLYPANVTTVWVNNPPLHEADYIIGVYNSTHYYAKNGTTGEIEFCGTNASQVIQQTINALGRPEGGIIFIKAGEYTLNSPISIANVNNMTIRGEGMGKTILKNAGIVKNDATPTYYLSIEDMTIDINNVSARNCINLASYTYYARIRNVEMKNTNNRFLLHWGSAVNLIVENCIFIDGGLGEGADNAAGSSYVENNATTIFRNNLFIKTSASKGGGMLTTGSSGRIIIEGNTFIDENDVSYAAVSLENSFGYIEGAIVTNNYGIGHYMGISLGNSQDNELNEVIVKGNNIAHLILFNVNHGTVQGNIIHDGKYGIHVKYSEKIIVDGNIIYNTNIFNSETNFDKGGIYAHEVKNITITSNIIFDNQTTPTTPYGIRISNTNYTLIDANSVSSKLGYQFVDAGGNGEIIFGENSFLTHNSGTATITSGTTSVTVNHGLTATPTAITVTPSENIGDVWVDSITSTSFTIHCETAPSSDVTVYWYAEYKP